MSLMPTDEQVVEGLKQDLELEQTVSEAFERELVMVKKELAEANARAAKIAEESGVIEAERNALRSHVEDLAKGGSQSTAPLVHFMRNAEKAERAMFRLREKMREAKMSLMSNRTKSDYHPGFNLLSDESWALIMEKLT